MTWPAAAIDPLIHILERVGFVDRELGGQEHQPRIPLPLLLSMLGDVGFTASRHCTFEFGLNNLLVCFKPPAGCEIGTQDDA